MTDGLGGQRNTRGQFVKGNTAGAGNRGGRPRRATEERYLRALSREVSLSDWVKIVRIAKELALMGDDKARAWLGNYLIGKPTEYVQADVSAVEPWLATMREIEDRLSYDDDDDQDDDGQE